ncbi:MAG TPA: DUF2933 domain-containing protein [Bacillales bacterium]|nr:DUF2933 domain-containing protein [Bacillales bacterium]
MQWLSYLLILLCPLMMIFMMKGHGGGHHNHDKSHMNHDLNKKIDLLQEENRKLRNEIENLSSIVKKDF